MPLFNKIVDQHKTEAVSVNTGDIVFVDVDHIYLQDGNIPTVARIFKDNGFLKTITPSKISCFIDHAVLSPSINITDRLNEAEAFAESFGLNRYRAGEGISHVVAMENGIFQPQHIVLGADSHTCTGGAVQCLSLGMGATDIVYAMLTGSTWLKVPSTQWIKTRGFPNKITSSKDVVLFALSHYQQAPFLYKSIEWFGEYVESLSLDAMATLANLSVEQGAKCAFFPKAADYEHTGLLPIVPEISKPDDVIELDISGLPPFVARPHLPFNGAPFYESSGTRISYVFIGSCANGRLNDLKEAAVVLKHQKIAPNVKCVITPGSKSIYLQALAGGLIETFVRAGALVTPPGCGPCVGTQGIVPGNADAIFSTMNRNFTGRMGNGKAPIYLGSPLLAAMTAVLGHIPDEKDLS
jgi:3-isopropylmalate/(R)-2-methylmalate dehydratase large subunit